MTKDSLFEYNSFKAAWDGLLKDWFMDLLNQPFNGLPSAIVVPKDSTIAFIKKVLLENGISIFGTLFLTPASLRQYLLNSFGEDDVLAIRENLYLIMKIAARQRPDNIIFKAAAMQPEQFVRIADLMETAGWGIEVVKNNDIKVLIEKYFELLRYYQINTAQNTNYQLLKRTRLEENKVFSDLVIFGFQSRHWLNFQVLLSGVYAAQNTNVCILTQDSARLLDQAWLGTWEEILGPSRRLDGVNKDKEKPFSYLSYYFNERVKDSIEAPMFIPEIAIANDVLEEAEWIVAKIIQQLASGEVQRLGIIFSKESSLLGREVARLLEKESISHNNYLKYKSGFTKQQQLLNAWIAWQKNLRLGSFLEFLDALVTEQLLDLNDFTNFKNRALEALQHTLTEDLRIIRIYLKSDQLWNQWPILPEEAHLTDYLEMTYDRLGLIIGVEEKRLIGHQTNSLLRILETTITKHEFFDWLKDVTCFQERSCQSCGINPNAIIHLMTEEEAILQEWSHLILCELNYNLWPCKESQIFCFNSDYIFELNRSALIQGNQGEGHLIVKGDYGLIPSGDDLFSITQDNFGMLLAMPTKRLMMTAHLKDVDQSDMMISVFYERVLRILLGHSDLTTIECLYKKTKSWIQSYHEKNRKHFMNAEKKYLDVVKYAYEQRRNIAEPFNEYSFSLSNSNNRLLNLSSKAWEELLSVPERGWFNHILKIRRNNLPVGKSLCNLSRGTWVHDWLNLETELTPQKMNIQEWSSQINAKACTVWNTMEKYYIELNENLPELWRTLWHNARRTALSLCHGLVEISEKFYFISEYIINENNEEVKGVINIPLKGRVDLIACLSNNLQDTEQAIWIIDFKTGMNENLTSRGIVKGIGLQLVLYALAFYCRGFKDISLSILLPNALLFRQVELHEVLECKNIFETINQICITGRLGLRNTMDSLSGQEKLFPLATLKIEEDILQKKWNLTHPQLLV